VPVFAVPVFAVPVFAVPVFAVLVFLAAPGRLAGVFLGPVVLPVAAVGFLAGGCFAVDDAVEVAFLRVDVDFLAAGGFLARLDVEVVFLAGTISQGSGERQCTGSSRPDLRTRPDVPQGPIVPTWVTRSR
jgi:hypothetical protein